MRGAYSDGMKHSTSNGSVPNGIFYSIIRARLTGPAHFVLAFFVFSQVGIPYALALDEEAPAPVVEESPVVLESPAVPEESPVIEEAPVVPEVPVVPAPAEGVTAEEAPTDPITAPSDSVEATGAESLLEPGALDVQAQMSLSASKLLISNETQTRPPNADQQTGAFLYAIPIEVPQGRNQMTPSVSLNYNSQTKVSGSLVGLSWSVSIPTITRLAKRGIDTQYAFSDFTSSFDGELVSTSGADPTAFGPKILDDAFRTYSYSGTSWIMTDKNGTRYTFGASASARAANPADSAQIGEWYLEEIRDTNQNFIKYEYTNINGRVYPSRIIYTGNGSTNGPYEVIFNREGRPDQSTSYKYAYPMLTAERIASVSVLFNGQLARSYALSYASNSSGRSLLSAVTETGYSEGGAAITRPAVQFSYRGSVGWSATQSGLGSLPQLADSTGKDQGLRIMDTNGDAVSDFVQAVEGQTAYRYAAPDFNQMQLNSFPAFVDASKNDLGIAMVDVNGDNYTDIVKGKQPTPATVYLFSNAGAVGYFASSTITNAPQLVDADGNDLGIRFGDFNGDGYMDYIRAREGNTVYLYLNNGGSGWNSQIQLTGIMFFVDLSGADTGARIMDVNGDGLDDILAHKDGVNTEVYINKANGTNWGGNYIIYNTDPNPPPTTASATGGDVGTRVIDINGDGLSDFVQSSPSAGHYTYINTGNGREWKRFDYWAQDIVDAQGRDMGYRFYNENNDGVPDILVNGALNFGGNGKRVSDNIGPEDELYNVTLSTGGTISPSYRGTSVANTVLRTVKSITYQPMSTSLAYAQGFSFGFGVYRIAPFDRKFAGFSKVDQFDTANNFTATEWRTTFYHQGNGSNVNNPNELFDSTTIGDVNDVPEKMYKPYRIEIMKPGQGLKYVGVSLWNTTNLGNGQTFVPKASDMQLAYGPSVSIHDDSAVEYGYSSATGNLLSVTNRGKVAGDWSGTFTDISGDTKTTTYTYATGSGVGVRGKVSTESTTNNAGTQVSETRHFYDLLGLGSVSIGNETRTESRVTTSALINTTATFNAYGMPTQTRDANGNTTLYEYDSFNLYPETIINAKNHETQYTYGYKSGKPLTIVDANAEMSSFAYDGFGRVLSESSPDPVTPNAQVLKVGYTYVDTPTAVSVRTSRFLDSGNTADSYVFYDGIGRRIQEKVEGENGTWITADTIYNAQNRVGTKSLPYITTQVVATPPTTVSSLVTTFTYDVFSRVLAQTNALGTTNTTYQNWTKTVVDPLSNIKNYYYDAYENLVRVDEVLNGTTLATLYGYNGIGALTSITDALGNVRSFTYDMLGRRLSAQDLHASSDVTFGTYTYGYDNAGNLTSKTTPNSQSISYTYDTLNRQLTEDYTAAAGIETSYTYDTCANDNGIGRLCTASSTGAIETRTYTPTGLTKQSTRTISGQAFITQYGYDRQGNVISITNPDNAVVRYTYGTSGKVEQISNQEAGAGSPTTLVSTIDYAPTGQPTYQKFNNTTESCLTYDTNALYRLVGKRTTANGYPCTSVPSPLFTEMSTTTYQTVSTTTYITSYIYATTTTRFFSTSGDGFVTSGPANGTWAVQHDNATGTAVSYTSTTGEVGVYDDTPTANSQRKIRRMFLSFNTSAIPDTATVTSATLGLRATSVTNQFNDGKNYLNVHKGTQANTTSLVTSDIDNCGALTNPIKGATDKTISTFSTSGYSTMPLNTTAVSWVSATTTTKLCLREGHDAENIRPSGLTLTAKSSRVTFRQSQYTGTGSDPYLDVTYVTATASTTATTTSMQVPVTATTTTYNLIQDLSYGYDAVGNILSINEKAPTGLGRSVAYGYDGLYRLTSASATASSSPYALTYTYNTVGNMLTNGGVSYTYAGTGYANPHAPTMIGPSSLSYDNAGNVLSHASSSYTWDFNNRMLSSAGSNGVSTYAYDSVGQRTMQSVSGVATKYPSPYFNTNGTLVTKHIMLGDMPVVTVTTGGAGGSTSTTTTHTVYADALAPGWNDWSWDSTRNFSNTTPVYAGTNSISVTYTAAWGGLYLNHAGVSTASSTHIQFAIRSAAANPVIDLEVYGVGEVFLGYIPLSSVLPTMAANTWYVVSVPLSSVAAVNTTITGLMFVKNSTGTIYYDDIKVVSVGTTGGGTGSATAQYLYQDHLGGTSLSADAAGKIIETADYMPFGAPRLTTSTGGPYEQRGYIGQEYDTTTSLSYLNARYYDGARGQFMSQDPVFWGVGQSKDGQRVLMSPQMQNSYSYSENNPIIKKDPDGRIGVLALFAVGALVNVSLQGLEDLSSGNELRWENYAGAAIGGVAGTAALLSTGGNLFAAGAIAQGSEEYASQWLKAATAKEGGSVDFMSVGGTALAGGIFGKIGLPGLKSITAGRNSMEAVTSQIITKLSNGTIKNFTAPTASKILTSQFLTGLPLSFALSGYNVSQSTAVMSVANSFGFSSLSSIQASAIEMVRSAFSK